MGSWLFLAPYARRGAEKTYDDDDALHTTFDWIPRFCSVQDSYFLKWTEKQKTNKKTEKYAGRAIKVPIVEEGENAIT